MAKKITRKELIKKFIEFYKSKNHKEIPNVSLIPENDPTVLFTTAGMHPLVPYLLGQSHPLGKRLVNVQRCIRTQDIDEVGDSYHHTFFEMLGNWSLGDYFKEKAIKDSFEFLVKVLKMPKERLAVTVFGGDSREPQVLKDEGSAKIWSSIGIPKEKIAYLKGGIYESKNNWWGPAGATGPCGPDTEMFYWKSNSINPPKKFDPRDERWLEIWNDVLMQYNKDDKGNYNPAKQKNVDTGFGLERNLTILNGYDDNYLTEIWQPVIRIIEKLSNKKYKCNELPMRIIADHIRAATFIIADGAVPSNTEQGYVLRRLIRRSVRYGKQIGIEKEKFVSKIAESIFKIYESDYPELKNNKKKIIEELDKEELKFELTLEKGLKIINKMFGEKTPINKDKFSKLMVDQNKSLLIGRIFNLKKSKKDYSLKNPKISKKEIDEATLDGKETFLIYQSYGFPLEMIDELATEKGFLVDHNAFREELKKHQELSRTAAEGRFKSGLADHSEQTTKLHTATHLLLEAIRKALKDDKIIQKGSNITPERLRLDFNFDRKLTQEELKKIENIVNEQILKKIPVLREEMTLEQAKKSGALGIFESKYGEKVSVYTVKGFSKEICAGPHVTNTSEIGKFEIKKEESSSAGIRRIKATVG